MPHTQQKAKTKATQRISPISPLSALFHHLSLFSIGISLFRPLFPFFQPYFTANGLIAPEKEKREQKENTLNTKSLWDWILNFLSCFITFSFKFQGRFDGVSIYQATRLLFLFHSTSRGGLPQPRYASPDLYVKFIAPPVTSAMPVQLKEEKKKKMCVYECVMGDGVGHGAIFLPL